MKKSCDGQLVVEQFIGNGRVKTVEYVNFRVYIARPKPMGVFICRAAPNRHKGIETKDAL
jgi:hypothetical protein